MEKITVLLLIAALAGSEASSLFRASKGACPVVTTKPNFQIDRYLGNWYEIQKLSNNFQAGMECNMATYALTGKWMSNFCFIRTASFHALIIGPTSISVFNSGMYEDGSPTNITGSAQQDLPDEPGHLTLQFFGRPAGNYLVRHVFCYPHEIDRWNNNDCLGSGLGNGLRQLHYRL